jgi:2-oxo-4-hydroxy-4-carboxy-5-ureidoimidazoline decarboxylase
MSSASEGVAAAMAQGNKDYESKMGFRSPLLAHTCRIIMISALTATRLRCRYIVCATGKTAEEMLAILQGRLGNAPDQELRNGADEQNKITKLRLNKLVSELAGPSL